MAKEVHLEIVTPPAYCPKAREPDALHAVDSHDVLLDVRHRLGKVETSLNMGHRIFAAVVVSGASWCAWLTNLLISRL